MAKEKQKNGKRKAKEWQKKGKKINILRHTIKVGRANVLPEFTERLKVFCVFVFVFVSQFRDNKTKLRKGGMQQNKVESTEDWNSLRWETKIRLTIKRVLKG
jgi:hypothetical protein